MSNSGKSVRQQLAEKTNARLAEAQANPEIGQQITDNTQGLAFVPLPDPANVPEDTAVSADAAPEVVDAAPLESPAASVEEAANGEAFPAASAAEPVSTATPAPAGEQQSTQAAAPVEQEEWEDAEWEDPTTKHQYRVKAPKGESEFLKKGWLARADYDKKLGVLGRVRQKLQPMIDSGYIEQVLPFFEYIDSDPTLAAAVGQLVNQRRQNQPLNYVQPGFEPQVHAQPAAQSQFAAQPQGNDEFADPYIQAAVSPILQKVSSLEQQLAASYQAQQQQQQQQLQQQQLAQQNAQKWATVHQELARQYPSEFTGDPNNQAEIAKLAQLDQYASSAGYDEQSYGYVGRITYAKQVLEQNTPRRVAAPVPSAAATSVAAAAQKANELARQASQNIANAMVVNAGNVAPAPPPKPRPLRDKNDKPLPIREAVQRSIANRKMKEASAR